MANNKEILQQQLCSLCRKYLSVGPIKVYYNKQIRCGRCSKNNDQGVESKLFLSVVKDMHFPCINSLEGCTEQLPIAAMKKHEENCKSNIYKCPLCPSYEGIALELKRHCENKHQKETIESMDFLIDLEKGSQEGCYFYDKEQLPIFVTFRCEKDFQTITLDLSIVGQKYQGDILQGWILCSVENVSIFKTKEVLCSILDQRHAEGLNINISKFKFYKKIMSCKFNVIKRPFSGMIKIRWNDKEVKTIVKDPYLHYYDEVISCRNLSKLPFDQPSESYYTSFAMNDIPWRFFFKKNRYNSVIFYLEIPLSAKYHSTKRYKLTAHIILLTKPQSERYIFDNYITPGVPLSVHMGELGNLIRTKKYGKVINDTVTVRVHISFIVLPEIGNS